MLSHQEPTVLLGEPTAILHGELVLGDGLFIDETKGNVIKPRCAHDHRLLLGASLAGLGAGLGLVDLALALLRDETELLTFGFPAAVLGAQVADRGGGVEAGVRHAFEALDGLVAGATSAGSIPAAAGGLLGADGGALEGLSGLELGLALSGPADGASPEELVVLRRNESLEGGGDRHLQRPHHIPSSSSSLERPLSRGGRGGGARGWPCAVAAENARNE